jgi:hypothetical protein
VVARKNVAKRAAARIRALLLWAKAAWKLSRFAASAWIFAPRGGTKMTDKGAFNGLVPSH